MPWKPRHSTAQTGDLAQLVGPRRKLFITHLVEDDILHTNYGFLNHNDLIGKPWGSQVYSHSGNRFLLLHPRISDLLLKIKRSTQILFPKDIGFILLNLGIGPGMNVLEAGTGSGAMTIALAYAVGDEGKVFSYEVRPEMLSLAKENVSYLNLSNRVSFNLKNIRDGIEETGIDVVFLDLPKPEEYIEQVRRALKSGGSLGCILPTTNQVATFVEALQEHHFDYIEVCEILLRYYKTIPQRIRPLDRMVAHTGYMVFARSILPE